MKPSSSINNELFASLLDPVVNDLGSSTIRKPAPEAQLNPLGYLPRHPHELVATSHGSQNRTAGECRRQNGTLKTCGNPIETEPNHKVIKLTETEFQLTAPFARSVKLAGSFTSWERYALDMIKSKAGVWRAIVPLPPGIYPYGFLVDGEWCDDPSPAQRVHNNPFGRADAIVSIV